VLLSEISGFDSTWRGVRVLRHDLHRRRKNSIGRLTFSGGNKNDNAVMLETDG
jgi:hypothetical protein